MEEVGLSQRYLSALEHDKVDLRFSVLVRFADALGVSLDALAGRPAPPSTQAAQSTQKAS